MSAPFRDIARLLRLELRQAWRARTVPAVAGALALAVLVAIVGGAAGHRERRRAATALVEQHRELLATVTRAVESDAGRSAAHAGEATRGASHPGLVVIRATDFRIALPPSPHATLAGTRPALAADSYRMRTFDDEFVPAFPTVGDRSLSGLIPERPIEPPEGVHRGRFSLSFVVVFVAPLLLLTAIHDIVSGERESGTLALAAAQPLTRGRWLTLKLAARAGPVWMAGVVMPLAGIVAVTVAIGESPSALRLLAWSVVVTAYFGFWTAAGVFASAASRSSLHSATTLAATYLVILVGVPGAADLAARAVAPLPPRALVAEREREARFEALDPISGAQQRLYDAVRASVPYTVGDKEAQARSTQAIWETAALPPRHPIIDAYLDRYGDLSTPAYTFQLRQILHRARADYIEGRMAPVVGEIDRQRRRQRSIIRAAATLSPALATTLVLEELAGVSDTRRERFLAQVDAYVRDWYDVIYGLMRRNRAVTPDVMSKQAPFMFAEESAAAAVGRVAALVIALLGTCAGSTVLAVRCVARSTPTM